MSNPTEKHHIEMRVRAHPSDPAYRGNFRKAVMEILAEADLQPEGLQIVAYPNRTSPFVHCLATETGERAMEILRKGLEERGFNPTSDKFKRY